MLNLKFFLLVISLNLLQSIASEVEDTNLSDEISTRFGEIAAPIYDERCDKLPAECHKYAIPHDCASATQCTKLSGIYKILIGKQCDSEPVLVVCDAVTVGGGWLVIQRRQDGSQDFYRNWTEYENGFGDIDGEFFIGLKRLHALTTLNGPQELLIVLEDNNGTVAYAKYSSFAIAGAFQSYRLLRIGRYSGTAGNSLVYHVNMKFTTKDRDNDLEPKYNCAQHFTGAWWYRNCHTCNLNGRYGDNTSGRGITWSAFRGLTVSLPFVKMMIRRSRG